MRTFKKISKERAYNIIREPIVTEKSTMGSAYSQVTFHVAKDATKPEIHQAVELLFDVKVRGVNTILRKGHTKRFRGRFGKQNDIKKAIVRLKEGQTIDVGSTL